MILVLLWTIITAQYYKKSFHNKSFRYKYVISFWIHITKHLLFNLSSYQDYVFLSDRILMDEATAEHNDQWLSECCESQLQHHHGEFCTFKNFNNPLDYRVVV